MLNSFSVRSALKLGVELLALLSSANPIKVLRPNCYQQLQLLLKIKKSLDKCAVLSALENLARDKTSPKTNRTWVLFTRSSSLRMKK
jgi:hypothetical protein